VLAEEIASLKGEAAEVIRLSKFDLGKLTYVVSASFLPAGPSGNYLPIKLY
jgi:hypothetical protein